MRLLNTNTLQLEEYNDENRPRYAILSHTWSKDEVSFKDVRKNRVHNEDGSAKQGYVKIMSFCREALDAGYNHVWVDTCCIDKTSSAELSEAINSMFQWYRGADQCWAYLEDVHVVIKDPNFNKQFSNSRWFTRGWTLQEMIAPREVCFYNAEWRYLGHRTHGPLCHSIYAITGVHKHVLIGIDFRQFSIAQRMRWAARRRTSRKEDVAYCLLGLFDVNMPLLYGEGEKAFIRLQKEIIASSLDHSIFAWGMRMMWPDTVQDPLVSTPRSSGENRGPRNFLASSPQQFEDCVSTEVLNQSPSSSRATYTLTNRGLQISLPVFRPGIGRQSLYAILSCTDRNHRLAVPLWAWFSSGEQLEFSRASNVIYLLAKSPTEFENLNMYIADVPTRFEEYRKSIEILQNPVMVLKLVETPSQTKKFRLASPVWSLIESQLREVSHDHRHISIPITDSGLWNVALELQTPYFKDFVVILEGSECDLARPYIYHRVIWVDKVTPVPAKELLEHRFPIGAYDQTAVKGQRTASVDVQIGYSINSPDMIMKQFVVHIKVNVGPSGSGTNGARSTPSLEASWILSSSVFQGLTLA